MYVPGTEQYKWHLEHYGHPSKTGYKDLVPLFKAADWDPDHLIDLYVKAGARYFVSMGVHHDNYDMWNSKYQKRWNAVAVGPLRDIVGEWLVWATGATIGSPPRALWVEFLVDFGFAFAFIECPLELPVLAIVVVRSLSRPLRDPGFFSLSRGPVGMEGEGLPLPSG